MENTQSIYIESINETWEMPDELALKLTEYKNDHTEEANDADALHRGAYRDRVRSRGLCAHAGKAQHARGNGRLGECLHVTSFRSIGVKGEPRLPAIRRISAAPCKSRKQAK